MGGGSGKFGRGRDDAGGLRFSTVLSLLSVFDALLDILNVDDDDDNGNLLLFLLLLLLLLFTDFLLAGGVRKALVEVVVVAVVVVETVKDKTAAS